MVSYLRISRLRSSRQRGRVSCSPLLCKEAKEQNHGNPGRTLMPCMSQIATPTAPLRYFAQYRSARPVPTTLRRTVYRCDHHLWFGRLIQWLPGSSPSSVSWSGFPNQSQCNLTAQQHQRPEDTGQFVRLTVRGSHEQRRYDSRRGNVVFSGPLPLASLASVWMTHLDCITEYVDHVTPLSSPATPYPWMLCDMCYLAKCAMYAHLGSISSDRVTPERTE